MQEKKDMTPNVFPADNIFSLEAKELSPLELNNIKLDIKHTILTPQYLEDLIQNKKSADSDLSS